MTGRHRDPGLWRRILARLTRPTRLARLQAWIARDEADRKTLEDGQP